MLRKNARFIAFVLLFMAVNCYSLHKAAEAGTQEKLIIRENHAKLLYEFGNEDNELIIRALQEDGSYKVITNESFYQLSNRLENIAKQVCNLKLKPQSVTVSILFLSATWNSKTLCHTNNDLVH